MEAWIVSGGGSSRNRRSNQPADEAVTKRELLEEKYGRVFTIHYKLYTIHYTLQHYTGKTSGCGTEK